MTRILPPPGGKLNEYMFSYDNPNQERIKELFDITS